MQRRRTVPPPLNRRPSHPCIDDPAELTPADPRVPMPGTLLRRRHKSAPLHWLWQTAGGEWRLSTSLGNLYQHFTKDAPSGAINGTYSVGSNATGTPTVADGTTAKWTFAEDTDDEPPILTVVVEYEVTAA
jgi:hypothetical protein